MCRLFLILLTLLGSCSRHHYQQQQEPQMVEFIQEVKPKNEEISFLASDGLNQYEGMVYTYMQNINGPLELYECKVTKYLMTDQNLAADRCELGGVNVAGTAWLHQSSLRNDSHFYDNVRFYESRADGFLTICGNFYASESKFSAPLLVDGEVTLDHCQLASNLTAKAEMVDLQCTTTQGIIVEATGPYYDHQVVRLANGSHVGGNITFKSGHGRVCIDKTSFLEGEIVGGHCIPSHYWQEH